MTRIFTKRFFRLTAADQATVVESVLRDIEQNCGRYTSPEDEKRARRAGPSHPAESGRARDIEGPGPTQRYES